MKGDKRERNPGTVIDLPTAVVGAPNIFSTVRVEFFVVDLFSIYSD